MNAKRLRRVAEAGEIGIFHTYKSAVQSGFTRAGEIHGWDRISQVSHSIL